MKILLVDDDSIARYIHSALLRMQGYEVLEATDGEIAWELIKKSGVSFVVSDWVMPNLAGIELCRRIRASDLERYIYVILCTSKGAQSDLIEGMDAGADDFLVKPISPEEFRVKVRAGERVLDLQQRLADKNRELFGINERLESAHKLIEDDLKAASWMQQNLLPPPTLKAHGAKCEWRLLPAGYVAGDIFNFFPLDDRHIAFYLLDVSGHGVPAAMLSVSLSMMLTADAAAGSPLKRYDNSKGKFEVCSPDETVQELNRRFQSTDGRYFTMIYGLFDKASSSLRIAQAGHPPPILIKRGGGLETLGTGGMPIGLWPEIEFDSFEVKIAQGDKLLLYSDGITECMNVRGESLGEERLLQYVARARDLPLDELLDSLLDFVKEWHGSAEIADDMSLLAIEMN